MIPHTFAFLQAMGAIICAVAAVIAVYWMGMHRGPAPVAHHAPTEIVLRCDHDPAYRDQRTKHDPLICRSVR